MRGGRSKADSKKPDRKIPVRSDSSKTKKAKPTKDPNKPKRPPSAFFVFMEDFRTQYKAEHPNNKSVAAVGKAGGDKWKSLSVDEKAPFVAKAEKRKVEYTKNMQAYNKKLKNEPAAQAEEDESDKSKSEVNDEDDEEDDEGSGEGEDDE